MNRMKELALIVAGIDEEYQNSVIDGIIACAKEQGAGISCFSAFGGVISGRSYDIGEYNIYELVNYDRFDGVLLMINTISDSAQKQKIVTRVRSSGLPVVVFDCADYPEFYNITIDNTAAMEELVRHVIREHGARRLEYISGPASNPEAQARLTAFRRVCLENNIKLSENSIHYGNFRSIDGRHAAEEIISRCPTLPDAVICANDAMALTAIAEFSRHGIRIPEDMIVTGFDNTYYARHHYPSLSTVERPLNRAGYLACETLMKLIRGEACDRVQKLDSKPVFAESCRCRCPEDTDIPAYKTGTYELIDRSREDINMLNRMNCQLAEAETEEECMSVISGFLGNMNCERCCICLCEGWDKDWESSSLSAGYSKKMYAPLIWDQGAVRYFGSFDSGRMNPVPHDRPGSISYFLPLHYRDHCQGYFVATNGDFPAKSMLCHSILMLISSSLENVRKLISLSSAVKELDRLYVIDPLCSIYNRNGFIRAADAKYRECRRSGEPLLISFIDMDGLKYINDEFGHNEGDLALQQLSAVLVDCCREGWICARFGGDEFILLGPGGSERDAEELEAVFRTRLDQINKLLKKPYDISASIGTVCRQITDSDTMFSLITKADELMYEKKKRNPSRYIRR